RNLERSTSMHNTVVVNGANQSEVWSSFRVGRRADVSILVDTKNSLHASHNGYKSILKQNDFFLQISDHSISLEYKLLPDQEKLNTSNIMSIHLNPDVLISSLDDGFILDGLCRVKIING